MDSLAILLKDLGFNSFDEYAESYDWDSIVPAICVNCNEITEAEPGCTDGLCSACGENKVKSILILGGVI
jgi:hypothetical protein